MYGHGLLELVSLKGDGLRPLTLKERVYMATTMQKSSSGTPDSSFDRLESPPSWKSKAITEGSRNGYF